MTNYGHNRIRSRAVKPKGRRDPNSFLIDNHPVNLGGEEGYGDGMGGFEGLSLLEGENHNSEYNKETKTLLSQPHLLDKSVGTFYNKSLGDDMSEHGLGLAAARSLRQMIHERDTMYNPDFNGTESQVESRLRDLDYLVAETGSTEDLVGARQALQEMESMEERETFMQTLEQTIDRAALEDLNLEANYDDEEGEEAELKNREDDGEGFMSQQDAELELVKDYDIKPHHDW
jgi:hypothetical protein